MQSNDTGISSGAPFTNHSIEPAIAGTTGNLHDLLARPGRRMVTARPHGRVLILDLDSTLTDTRPWFASLILSLTSQLADQLKLPQADVNCAYVEIASATTLHEYAYIVEALASKLQAHKQSSFSDILKVVDSLSTAQSMMAEYCCVDKIA